MRGNNPEINPQNAALILKRNLALSDWILLLVGLILFTAGFIFLGPVKFAIAIAFLILVVVAFFSPKYGMYVLFGCEGLYILVFYVNMMALAPQQLGLAYTISYYIEGAELFIAPLMVLYVSYLMGFVVRAWLQKTKYVPTPFEQVLTAYLIFCVLWVTLSIANNHYPLVILTDIHVILMYTFAIFIGRSFKKIEDFKSLFNFLIVISLFHWVFLTGYFFQQRLYTEVLFILDLVRSIQGSSDIYSPFIPVMLAILALSPGTRKTGFEKYYSIIIFLFSVRTILCLSRGAMLQVIISVIILYFWLPAESRKLYLYHVKRQFVYAFIFIIMLFAIAPSKSALAFKLIFWRTTTGGDTGGMSQGSLKYRALETQMVWEDVVESPIFGYGPGRQTKKRMFIYSSAALEPYVHNGFLWIVLKFGFIGLFVYLFVIFKYFQSARNQTRGSPPLQKAMLMGTSAAMIGIIAIVVTNNVIMAVQGVIFISFALGVAIFAEKQQQLRIRDKDSGANAEA